MALAAFLRRVVVYAGGMTAETECPLRCELRDRRLVMAFHAAGMGIDRRRVSLADLCGLVAGCAIGLTGMVIVVAGDASLGSWLRLEGDGGGMTLRACDLPVFRVVEDHRPSPRCMLGNRDLDRQRACDLHLVGRMTVGALRAGRGLVMTDLTAAWRLKRQTRALARRGVAGDAGQRLVAVMREGVTGGGGWGEGCSPVAVGWR